MGGNAAAAAVIKGSKGEILSTGKDSYFRLFFSFGNLSGRERKGLPVIV